jgi:hypothetical protein
LIITGAEHGIPQRILDETAPGAPNDAGVVLRREEECGAADAAERIHNATSGSLGMISSEFTTAVENLIVAERHGPSTWAAGAALT